MIRLFFKVQILLGITALLTAYLWHSYNPPFVAPNVELEFWGNGQPMEDDPRIRPFVVTFPQNDVEVLYRRLRTIRLEEISLTDDFLYGINPRYMRNFLHFWITQYNWTERESQLNSFSHFKTQIGGLDIHFMHVKPDPWTLPQDYKVVPLLLLHSWPGSFREFYSILPLLTTPREGYDFVFEVVIPSLPGYGFSDPPLRPGLGMVQTAPIFAELMRRLGYSKFIVQGGDWGTGIGSAMSILFQDRVMGFHSNMCMKFNFKTLFQLLLTYHFPKFIIGGDNWQDFPEQVHAFMKESGYVWILSNKPDTLGIGLADSPLGLAAFMLQKFSSGTNWRLNREKDGGLAHLDRVDLLDNIMIYWLTKSVFPTLRYYKETYTSENRKLATENFQIPVPVGCARLPNDFMSIPRWIIEKWYPNLVQITDFKEGGHFAAMEVPHLLAEDIWTFTQALKTRQTETETSTLS